MKPDNVNAVLLTGSSSSKVSSFLLQCANHYSDQGFTVLYIAPASCDLSSVTIHGTRNPTVDTISRIRFLYFRRWQELLKYLFSMHLYPYVPRVIFVQNLDYYCNLSSIEGKSEKYEHEAHCAKICAALLDSASFCARKSNCEVVLMVSFEIINKAQEKLVSVVSDLYFNSAVWLFERTKLGDVQTFDEISVSCLASAGFGEKIKLEFLCLENDEELMLHKIEKFTHLI